MTMLEKAARAAFDYYWAEHAGNAQSKEYWWKSDKEKFIGEARAVLMAVREAGLEVRKVSRFSTAEVEWSRMIDAILNEGRP